ncbi:hypothetical protein GCM10010080_25060 [Thermomonas carbonis]|nr:hypothetical protein GCM10010080_25060 [Thermomonas carbonis]
MRAIPDVVRCLKIVVATGLHCWLYAPMPVLRDRPQTPGMALMAKNEKTSPSVASKASKQLSNPKSTTAQKAVAASALTQAANKPKGKR